jgi:oligoribonuclease
MQAIFLDIETTGLDPVQHSPIDIAFKIIDMTQFKTLTAYRTVIKHPIEVWNKHDPSSIQVNGFTWEQIDNGQPPLEVQEQILQIFSDFQIQRGNAVFICQNPSFDRGFFSQIILKKSCNGLTIGLI